MFIVVWLMSQLKTQEFAFKIFDDMIKILSDPKINSNQYGKMLNIMKIFDIVKLFGNL